MYMPFAEKVTQRNIPADKLINQNMCGKFSANKMVISHEPIKLIVKNKEIGKDVMTNSDQKKKTLITY